METNAIEKSLLEKNVTGTNAIQRNALEVRNLTKRYGDFMLDHISFSLPEGCIMGLIGENGAGKSTTIRLIMNTVKRDEGEITVLGKDNTRDFNKTKEEIGVVMAETNFPETISARQLHSIMRNIYCNWEEDRYFAYLKSFDLPENKRFGEYSRGMGMKLSIAIALSHGARLLILDEATGGLDPVVRDEILDLFIDFTRQENHSVLISSHIVSDLEKICDYIGFLHKGKLVFNREKDELQEEYGILRLPAKAVQELDPAAIEGRKDTPYGTELLVRRSRIPGRWKAERASVEDIMLFMVKSL